MNLPIAFWLVIAAAPLLLLFAGKKLTKHTLAVFGVMTVVTWIATTLLLTRLLQDNDDIWDSLFSMLVLTPALGIGVASTVGRMALKAPSLAAIVFACQGWYVGVFLMVIVLRDTSVHDGDLWNWGCAVFTAIPATWAALGTAVAGNLKWRWQA